LFETLKHFGHQTLKLNGYSSFNPITLNFFDVPNMIHASI